MIFPLWIYIALTTYAKQPHLEKLKSHYPYGVIGNDYEILTEEDLAVNTCNTTRVIPFTEGENQNYSYWQCFLLKKTQMKCDSLGYDSVQKKETGYLEVEVREKMIQSYLARDAMSMRECKSYLRDWRRKTRGEKYVCLSGTYGRWGEVKNGKKEMDWIFDKFKTRKGCVSHRSECQLKEVWKGDLQNCQIFPP